MIDGIDVTLQSVEILRAQYQLGKKDVISVSHTFGPVVHFREETWLM